MNDLEAFHQAQIDLSERADELLTEDSAILRLVAVFAEAEKTAQGLPSFVTAVEVGKTSNAQLGQMVKVLSQKCALQAEALRDVAALLSGLIGRSPAESLASNLADTPNRFGTSGLSASGAGIFKPAIKRKS